MKILLSPAKSIQTEGIKAEVFSEMPRFVSEKNSKGLSRKHWLH
jgi:hypothetical protein